MKSFKFFRGYGDDLVTRFLETEYRYLGNTNVLYGGVDLADGPDTYGNVGTRRINATWTREMAEDVAHFHNIDAEAELTALLTETIAQNIDRNILRGFRQRCGIPPRYFNNQLEVSHSGVTFINQNYTPIIQGII